MILNDKFFSLPPFISTSWDRVSALRFEGENLVIDLTNGVSVPIPSVALPNEMIELIFNAHAEHLGNFSENNKPSGMEGLKFQLASDRPGQFPVRMGMTGMPFDGIGSLQHSPEMANAPDLPKDLINKITSITKIVAGEEVRNFPKGEPHCNCFYCQIARNLHGQSADETEIVNVVREEEVVSENELQFQQWNIKPTGNQLFTVTNKLDINEQYNVYLGNPVGCTCGKQGCEHIVAVLKS